MVVDSLPTPPSTTDAADFDARADLFLAALPHMVDQFNDAFAAISGGVAPVGAVSHYVAGILNSVDASAFWVAIGGPGHAGDVGSDTLAAAESYTDTHVASALASANAHADSAASAAQGAAQSHADTAASAAQSAAQGHADGVAAAAQSAANSFTSSSFASLATPQAGSNSLNATNTTTSTSVSFTAPTSGALAIMGTKNCTAGSGGGVAIGGLVLDGSSLDSDSTDGPQAFCYAVRVGAGSHTVTMSGAFGGSFSLYVAFTFTPDTNI